MKSNQFQNLNLIEPILRALTKEGYETPTSIQEAAIPIIFEGKDLLATAQTGTGKTAAFSLPILQKLYERKPDDKRNIRALVLTPTRELAQQVETSFRTYGRNLSLRTTVIVGGVSQGPQIKALKNKVDILVATPGRLLDLINQGHVHLNKVEILVLDEADRMLDMGFITDVRKIISKITSKPQTLFFSATLTDEIQYLAYDILNDPSIVTTTPSSSVTKNIEQKVLFVTQENKRDLLSDILQEESVKRALVFSRTKRLADRLMKHLLNRGISVEAIHSDKSQNARQRALAAFDRGRVKVLVGTDIVARGIDVEGISHVINYDLPEDPENYVHRIGRTARAGANGIALSFCGADEILMLKGIEKLIKQPLIEFSDHAFHSSVIAEIHKRRTAAPRISPPFGRRRNKPRATGGRRSAR
ncbi:MAG: DEAD/DEAH box helicase [Candidatus Latescibacteria bacterium]|nr:DEAD/DEAH box helicase [Candidatus Latescibacterota bacterium]